MSDFAITNEKIWPTDADVGSVDGDGDGLFELNLASWLAKAGQANFVSSGLNLPSTDPDLNIDIPAGVAVIDGRVVTVPGTTTITVGNNTTSYVYLRMDKTSSKAVSATYEVNTTGTPPTDSVPLAIIVSSGGTCVITDTRVTKPSFTANNRITVFNTPGAFSFVARTNWARCKAIAGGGGGGGSAAASGGGGGGGGAGAYVEFEFATIPGKKYSGVVGAAGTAGASAGAGGNGGNTYIDTDAEGTRANGGTGGAGGASGAGGAGGTGTTDSSHFKLPGQAGGSKSGTTGGTAGVTQGMYQPVQTYGGGAAGTTGAAAAVGTVGQAGLMIIED